MSRENHIYEPDWSGRTDQLCSVNKPVIKKDALALVTGKPVYVDDLAPHRYKSARVPLPPRPPIRRLHRHYISV